MTECLGRGESAVLVTVTAASGSTPRKAGARMLVTGDGLAAGTIGGGAVEHASIELAAQLLRKGAPAGNILSSPRTRRRTSA